MKIAGVALAAAFMLGSIAVASAQAGGGGGAGSGGGGASQATKSAQGVASSPAFANPGATANDTKLRSHWHRHHAHYRHHRIL